jgi:hypothetical protein
MSYQAHEKALFCALYTPTGWEIIFQALKRDYPGSIIISSEGGSRKEE